MPRFWGWKGVTFAACVAPVLGSMSPAVVDITSSNYKDVLGITNENVNSVYIMFYAPWCGHCAAAQPAWERVAERSPSTMTVARLNCEDEPYICHLYHINQYPSFDLIVPVSEYGNSGGDENGGGLVFEYPRDQSVSEGSLFVFGTEGFKSASPVADLSSGGDFHLETWKSHARAAGMTTLTHMDRGGKEVQRRLDVSGHTLMLVLTLITMFVCLAICLPIGLCLTSMYDARYPMPIRTAAGNGGKKGTSALAERLRALPPDERRRWINGALRKRAAKRAGEERPDTSDLAGARREENPRMPEDFGDANAASSKRGGRMGSTASGRIGAVLPPRDDEDEATPKKKNS